MARDSFIFYRSFYEAIEDIDTESQLELYNAICRKSLYDEDTELNGIAGTLYKLIRPQLDANTERYENGKKGGRPKKETTGFEEQKTIGFENKKPNKNNNVNENVNVNNNNNNASDSCVDGLQKVIDFYNNNIGALTPFGLETLSDYSKEFDADVIIYAMQISVEANKRTIQYIKAILNNWQKKGITTLIEAKNESQKKVSKPKTTANFEQRQYDNLDYLYTNYNMVKGV